MSPRLQTAMGSNRDRLSLQRKSRTTLESRRSWSVAGRNNGCIAVMLAPIHPSKLPRICGPFDQAVRLGEPTTACSEIGERDIMLLSGP